MRLLSEDQLPLGFVYPSPFLRMVERGIVHLEPWWVFDGEQLQSRFFGLSQRYLEQALVPFARREDNDDVACWDAQSGDQVFIVHDHSSAGWETRVVLDDLYAWLRKAVEDMIEFDELED